MSDLVRTIYLSQCNDALDANTLLNMCAEFSRRNAVDGISGLLLVAGQHFLQIIEGSEDAVQSLMLRIFDDRRHTNLLLLSERSVDSRIFGSWAMRGLNVDQDHALDPLMRSRIRKFVHDASAAASHDAQAARALVSEIARFLRGKDLDKAG